MFAIGYGCRCWLVYYPEALETCDFTCLPCCFFLSCSELSRNGDDCFFDFLRYSPLSYGLHLLQDASGYFFCSNASLQLLLKAWNDNLRPAYLILIHLNLVQELLAQLSDTLFFESSSNESFDVVDSAPVAHFEPLERLLTHKYSVWVHEIDGRGRRFKSLLV